LGIGAKTAAGYGVFRVKDFTPPALPSGRAEAQFDLTLVTPAFLAGSAQKAEDCDLRGATLRGQLRWWWRTMHAAHLEPRVLRRLETAVWGASSEGSAVQVRVTRSVDTEAHRFDFKADANSTFLRDNGIPPSNRAVPESEKRKTTQGLYYAAYGATPDKVKGIEKPGRFFRQPGATWQLYLTARSSFYRLEAGADASFLPADAIWKQAISALFLLTRFGGVGAKARKGFGSFTDVAVTGIDSILDCKRIAAEFRERCGLTLQPHDWAAPSLELMSEPIVIETKWTNAWFALNRIGEATQAYAKKGKHQAWKAALGLPRKSDAPSAVPVGKETMLQPEVTIPAMGKVRLERHAAPAHFHVAKAGGQLAIRLVTFVSPHLPDRTTSRQRLDALRANVHASLHEWRNDGGTAPLSPKPRSVVAPVDASELRVGYVVQAELLEEKTPKGGWKAKHLPSGRISSILNTLSVPPDKKPGDMVELQVHSRTEFKWPVAKPQATPPPRHVVPRGRR
jgi:CRISPR-associated protein Cmr6